MRIVIDIDEDYVKIINKNGASNYLEEVIENGIKLPNNATNGDVIKILFPNLRLYSDFAYWDVDLGDTHISVDKKWWCAPYKAESEEWVNFAEDLIPLIDEAESEDKE